MNNNQLLINMCDRVTAFVADIYIFSSFNLVKTFISIKVKFFACDSITNQSTLDTYLPQQVIWTVFSPLVKNKLIRFLCPLFGGNYLH